MRLKVKVLVERQILSLYGEMTYGEYGFCFLGVDVILQNGCRI